MNEIHAPDDQAKRVTAAVDHALALVGPAERGSERERDDRPMEETAG